MGTAAAIVFLVAMQLSCAVVSFAKGRIDLFLVSTGIFTGGAFFAVCNAVFPNEHFASGFSAVALGGSITWLALRSVRAFPTVVG